MAIFYNQATLSYRNVTVASNLVTGEITEAVSVSKTAVEPCYRAGGTVTYVIHLINAGTVPFADLTLTDDLGAYAFGGGTVVPLEYVEGSLLVFADGVEQPTPAVTGGQSLTVSGLSLPAGYNVAVIYQAAVNGYAPLGTGACIENTVTVEGGQLPHAVTASCSLPICQNAELSLTKALSPTAVTGNGRLTYTFVLENRGLTEASGDVVLADGFDPILSDLTVTCGGQSWSEGTEYTYDQTTGEFASLAGALTIPAATAVQDPATGVWGVEPGTVTVVICGNI